MRCKLWEIQVCSPWLMIAKIAVMSFFILAYGGIGYGQNVSDNLEGNLVPETHVYAKSILAIEGLAPEKAVTGVDTFLNGIPLTSGVLHKPGLLKEKRENSYKTVYWSIGVDLGFMAEDGQNTVDYTVYFSDGSRLHKRSQFTKDRQRPQIKVVQSEGLQKSFWVSDASGLKEVRVQVYKDHQLHTVQSLSVLVDTPERKFFVFNHPLSEFVISAIDNAGNFYEAAIGSASLEEIAEKVIDPPLAQDPQSSLGGNSGPGPSSVGGFDVQLLVFYDPKFEDVKSASKKGTITMADVKTAGLLTRDAVNGKGYVAPQITKVHFEASKHVIPFDSADPAKRPILYVKSPPGQLMVPKLYAKDAQLVKNFLDWAGQFKQDNNVVIVLVENVESRNKECGMAYPYDGLAVVEVVIPAAGNCYALGNASVPTTLAHETAHLWGLDHDISPANTKSIIRPTLSKSSNSLSKPHAMYYSAHVLSPSPSVKYAKAGIAQYSPVGGSPENQCGNAMLGAVEWCDATELDGGVSGACLNPDPKFSNPPALDPVLQCNWSTGNRLSG